MRAIRTMSAAHLCRLALSAPLLLTVAGCGFDLPYALSAVGGQAELLLATVPIEQALADESLSAEQRAKLELIIDARLYARDVMGLYVENAFTSFYDSHGTPVAYNVSASHRDALTPRTWTFPFVGTIPYLGYFESEAARNKVEELQREGLDAYMYELDAYNLAFLPDPVLSPMLRRDDLSLIDTVIHELLHQTVNRPGDGTDEPTKFDESLATFVARQGALDYLRDRFPDEPQRLLDARERSQDFDRYAEFTLELLAELDAFYKSSLTSEEKIGGREAVFQAARDRFALEIQPTLHNPERFDFVLDLPTNNACLLLFERYNLKLQVFADVFEAAGRRWPFALNLYRQAAQFEGDPYRFLQDWLTGQPLRSSDL